MNLFGLIEGKTDPKIFTPWTLTHLLAGASAAEIGIPFWYWEMIHAAYEFKDYVMNSEGDVLNSFPNSIGDQVATTAGHLLAPNSHYPGKFSILYMFTWAILTYAGEEVG